MKEQNNIYKIALLVSLSCVLQISESYIPHPVPGLRLGLANIMTLLALVDLGFKASLEVAILRTIVSSFMMGTFMSPTFILSFSGALISAFIMGSFYRLARTYKRFHLSIVGISILGALSHNAVQLYLAYLLLIRHKAIFIFLPWLSIGALIMGWVTGVAAGRICCRLKEMERQEAEAKECMMSSFTWRPQHYAPSNSFFHRLPAQTKIISLLILSLAVLVVSHFLFYLGLFFALIMIAVISQTSFDFLLSRVRKCTSLVFASFFFPVFFNSGKHVLLNTDHFRITYEGLNTGALFAFRIIFLIAASSLLIRITSPEDLTQGLARVLSPLKVFGVSKKRIATILSLSWMAIPVFWDMARNTLRKARVKEVRNLSGLIALLVDFIVGFYLETEQIGVSSKYKDKPFIWEKCVSCTEAL